MKSKTFPEPTSLQPSAQDAANRSSTQIAPPSLPFEADRDACVVLLCMLEGLFANVMSSDLFYLSVYRAEDTALKAGVAPEKTRMILNKLIEFRHKAASGNPTSA